MMKNVWILVLCLIPAHLYADIKSDLRQCAVIEDSAERLRCLDNVVTRHAPETSEPAGGALPESKSISESREIPRDQVPKPQTGQRDTEEEVVNLRKVKEKPALDESGERKATQSAESEVTQQDARPEWAKPRPEVKKEEKKEEKKRSKTREQFKGVIAGVRKLPGGQYKLTLNDGQIWREVEAKRRSRYRIGDEVVISKGFIGSFDLKSVRTGFQTKVKRVD